MSKIPERLKRMTAALALVLLAVVACPAQSDEEAFKKLEAIDYSKQTVTREQLMDWTRGRQSDPLDRTMVRGRLDVPLNEVGRAEAQEAARALVGSGIVAVYTSPLGRAREVARSAVVKVPMRIAFEIVDQAFQRTRMQ